MTTDPNEMIQERKRPRRTEFLRLGDSLRLLQRARLQDRLGINKVMNSRQEKCNSAVTVLTS